MRRYAGFRPAALLPLLISALFCGAAESGIVSEDENSLKFRQNDGTEVLLPKRPGSTVICYSSLVQVWYAAGGTAVAIPAVPTRDTLPEAARGLPQLGTHNTMSAEKIMMHRPDLVLLNDKLPGHRQLRRTLAELNIPAACIDYRNYRDFREIFELFRRLNGSGASADAITGKVDALCMQARRLPSPAFASIYIGVGIRAETDRANAACMAALLGGRNIVPPGRSSRGPFSYEQLLLRDPDVIFLVTTGNVAGAREVFRKEFEARPEWKSLRAVKNNRVHFLPPDLFLYLPGSRFPEAFRHLAKLLYPDQEFIE